MKNSIQQSPAFRSMLRALFVLAFVAVWTACSDDSDGILSGDNLSSGPKAMKLGPPKIDFLLSTRGSIDLQITSDESTGAPNGFSLQWMTKAQFDAAGGQWPIFDSTNPNFCKAGFSGSAYGNNYSLAKGQSVIIRVGDFLPIEGASTSCPDALICGTEYVFRAFAHAKNTYEKSDMTGTTLASTDLCGTDCGFFNRGYWRNNSNPYPLNENCMEKDDGLGNITTVCYLNFAGVNYTEEQVRYILSAAPAGNQPLIPAKDWLTIKLGLIQNGLTVESVGSDFVSAYNEAEAFFQPFGNLATYTGPTLTGKDPAKAIGLANLANRIINANLCQP